MYEPLVFQILNEIQGTENFCDQGVLRCTTRGAKIFCNEVVRQNLENSKKSEITPDTRRAHDFGRSRTRGTATDKNMCSTK